MFEFIGNWLKGICFAAMLITVCVLFIGSFAGLVAGVILIFQHYGTGWGIAAVVAAGSIFGGWLYAMEES